MYIVHASNPILSYFPKNINIVIVESYRLVIIKINFNVILKLIFVLLLEFVAIINVSFSKNNNIRFFYEILDSSLSHPHPFLMVSHTFCYIVLPEVSSIYVHVIVFLFSY